MTSKTRIFVFMSAALFALVAILVSYGVASLNKDLERTVAREARNYQANFDVLFENALQNMLMIATLVGNEPAIKALFLAGKKAVEREGGGAGGAAAQKSRSALYDTIAPSWRLVQQRYDVRQLQFHLGPGAVSFLRVHKPESFGDDLSSVRFTIVDTNAERRPRSGFELGRVSPGIRGMVPVNAVDPETGQDVHVGVLEAGDSFDSTLAILDKKFDVGVAVLLRSSALKEVMWPEVLAERYGESLAACACVVDAVSRAGIQDLFANGLNPETEEDHQSLMMIRVEGKALAVSRFPIRDYLGGKQPQRGTVGNVVIWKDVSPLVADLDRRVIYAVLLGLGGFCVLELLLFFVLKVGFNHLETEVDRRTVELSASKNAMERQAAKMAELAETESDLVKKLNYEVNLKNRFFSIIAHDLKSPFTSLLGMTEVMARMGKNYSQEKLVTYAEDVNRAGRKVFDLLDNLLVWARTQMDGTAVQAETVGLKTVVEEAADALSHGIVSKGLSFHHSVHGVDVFCDPDSARFVLRNLLANAIKFTRPGGRIEITAVRTTEGVKVTVADTGVGISEETAQWVFALDHKTTTLGTEGEAGTGLGLPLCREMIEKNGGRIWLDSQPGEGTSVSFTLPTGP